MKDRMESFLVLPFSIHCTTHSSTGDDVAISQSKKPHLGSNPLLTRRKEVNERSPAMKMKRSWGFLALRRSFISRGIHKLITTLKRFSQLFVYNEEEEEMEMEIGYPTDVQHVTHIGLDGSMTTSNTVKEKAISFPSISLSQFELAMAAQATTPVLASLP